jgi:spore maturation protein CgeB
MDVFQHYLNNEDARLDMAQKAQNICLQKHTWKVRMEEFINHINAL